MAFEASHAELWMILRDPDSCLIVRRSAPLLLERYVLRPGGLSDCKVHDGGDAGQPERPVWTDDT